MQRVFELQLQVWTRNLKLHTRSNGADHWRSRVSYYTLGRDSGRGSLSNAFLRSIWRSESYMSTVWRIFRAFFSSQDLNDGAVHNPSAIIEKSGKAWLQQPLKASSQDVTTIGIMVEQLKALAEESLHKSLNSTGFSRPLALSKDQDWIFTQALQLSTLPFVSPGWSSNMDTAIAASAAYGIGMCQHYRRAYACVEEMNGRIENVLVVEYTGLVYSVRIILVHGDIFDPWDEAFVFSSPDLGAISAWRSHAGDKAYWAEICRRTRKILEPQRCFLLD